MNSPPQSREVFDFGGVNLPPCGKFPIYGGNEPEISPSRCGEGFWGPCHGGFAHPPMRAGWLFWGLTLSGAFPPAYYFPFAFLYGLLDLGSGDPEETALESEEEEEDEGFIGR